MDRDLSFRKICTPFRIERREYIEPHPSDASFWAARGKIILSRALPQAFIQIPLDILSRNPGLLDPWGGLALAFITAILYGQRKHLPFWRTLDVLTPGFAALAISIEFANLASGDAFGKPTDLPWAIYLWGDYRHPTQIYEIMLLSGLLGVILTNMKIWVAAKAGLLFLTFLAGAAAITSSWRLSSEIACSLFKRIDLCR